MNSAVPKIGHYPRFLCILFQNRSKRSWL